MNTTRIVFQALYENSPDTSWLDEPYNADLKASWERDEWHFIGVRAIVSVEDRSNGTRLELRSPGVWGVQSDSDPDYLMSLGSDELDGMSDVLAKHNIDIAGIKPEWRDI